LIISVPSENFDVDVALVHPRQLCRDLVGLVGIDDVDSGRLADLPAPERLDVEQTAPEWQSPGAQLKILE